MIVFTNGCFDLIHVGHIELFKFCKQYGRLIVGLNSDNSVRILKGPNRPKNNQEDRKIILESIRYVDEVIIFDELTPYELIKKVKPDILVKGSDYKLEDIVGRDLVSQVLIFPFKVGYSTTNLLK